MRASQPNDLQEDPWWENHTSDNLVFQSVQLREMAQVFYKKTRLLRQLNIIYGFTGLSGRYLFHGELVLAANQ